MEKRGAHHFLTNYTLAVGSHRSLRKLIPTARGYIAFVIGGGIAHCFPSPRGSTKPCKSLRLSTFLAQGNPPRRSEATKAAMHGSATGSLCRHSSGGFLIGAVAGVAARGEAHLSSRIFYSKSGGVVWRPPAPRCCSDNLPSVPR